MRQREREKQLFRQSERDKLPPPNTGNGNGGDLCTIDRSSGGELKGKPKISRERHANSERNKIYPEMEIELAREEDRERDDREMPDHRRATAMAMADLRQWRLSSEK